MNIKNRYTGDVIFDGPVAKLRHANLRHATLMGFDLRHANLRDVDLTGADLTSVALTGATLRHANLMDVELMGAELLDADLRDVDLTGAKNFYLLPVQDMRGYAFAHAVNTDGGWRIRVGCRDFSIAEARKHWGEAYEGDREQGDMYLHAIEWLERKVNGSQPWPSQSNLIPST